MRLAREGLCFAALATAVVAGGCPGSRSRSLPGEALPLSGPGPGRAASAAASSPTAGPDEPDPPEAQLPPDARADELVATISRLVLDDEEHAAPAFGGGDFGIHLVEPGSDLRSPPTVPFTQPLRLARTIAPVFSNAVADFYELHQRQGKLQIYPDGPATIIWGYEGEYPGPTIVAKRGRPVVVRQFNELPEVVATHLHGMRSPPESDGGPTQVVPPGAFRDYFYPNPLDKPAATLWYHDHANDVTGPHVYKGLAGFYVLDDPQEDAAFELPSGEFDVGLAIADRIFSRNHQFLFPPFEHNGVYGDKILVNGVIHPFFRVHPRKYRFRILNGSNARTYQIALSDASPFTYVGTGAGAVPAPVELRTLQLAGGDRNEIVIDFGRYPRGSQVTLLNLAGRLPGTQIIMRFDVVLPPLADGPPIPPTLRPITDFPDASTAAVHRTFDFERRHGQWVINGKIFEPNRIDATPRLDVPEIWTLVNKSGGWVHPIHPHLSDFLILDRNGVPARSTDVGPRDIVLLHENETVRFLIVFRDYSGKYAFHCHLVEHEDSRMMGNVFTVGASKLPTFIPDLFPFPLFPPPTGPTLGGVPLPPPAGAFR